VTTNTAIKKRSGPRRERLSTDFQSSDAHLRTIFDNTETAYLLLDHKLSILSFNRVAEETYMLGIEKQLQKGGSIVNYIPQEGKEQIIGYYSRALDGEHLNYETSFQAAYGQFLWYNFQLSPVVNDKNKILGLVLAISDITKKKKAELEKEKLSEALRSSHLGLKKLVARVNTAKEEERLHIAREVHDELGQILTTTKIEVSMLKKKLSLSEGNPSLQLDFTHILELIDKSIKSVKKIATDLRPEMLDELGLVESIKWQVEEFNKNAGAECTLSISKEFMDLSHDINRSTTLYRIVQEALTNIARHANATKVKVVVKTSIDNIFLVIQDNGIGISEEQKSKKNSFGLTGLRERVLLLNGIIDFTGQPKGGTIVYVQIPYFI